ncbi:glycosyltransferase [Clostridium sp. PL3]|uniref:Glycosyltransferase n=1 Tax=Clostridium thailandense TaxID=2794346 RepID=A0A949TW95_9CLOT|nr:glycosyltransferase [Clostridium thailandense]MBV7271529.1 glycosyltransferase [Clostridium thailandense]
MKKVLILLSVYDGELYLREQIESLLQQENVLIDIFIRDDKSKDKSMNIINDIMSKNVNIKLISDGKNLGACGSFMELLKKCPCDFDYYAFCDQDDVWKPDKIYSAIEKMDSDSVLCPKIYCSAAYVTDSSLNVIYVLNGHLNKLDIYKSIADNRTVGCTTVFNKELLFKYRETVQYIKNELAMHDQWLYLLCAVSGKVYFDNRPYIYYRQHGNNTLGVNSGKEPLSEKIERTLKDELLLINKRKVILQMENLLTIMDVLGISDKLYDDMKKFLQKYKKNIMTRLLYSFNSPFGCYSYRRSVFLKINYTLRRL